MPPEAEGTRRADRDGVSVTPSLADTEGPRLGTRFRVAVEGVSERSERGRASDEGSRTRLAKENPTKWSAEQGRTQPPAGPAKHKP